MPTRYIVGCGTVARNGRGQFLLVRQESGYWKGQWIFPGGKLELGETLDQCAGREFTEETGCHVNITKQVGAYTSYDPNTDLEKQVVLVYYHGDGVTGEPCVGEGVTDVGWFSLAEMETMANAGNVPKIILQVAKDTINKNT